VYLGTIYIINKNSNEYQEKDLEKEMEVSGFNWRKMKTVA